jgi:radical SAM protein with 4Fe4S-binding SPASM domain
MKKDLQLSGQFKKTGVSLRRRMGSILKRCTLKKLLNLALLAVETKFRVSRLRSHPVYLRINPCSICNLRCPSCVTGTAGQVGTTRLGNARMSFESFKKCLAPLKEYLFEIVLYDEGEPLLNSEVELMVEYAHKNNINTCISTNLSFKLTDERIDRLVSSGLDRLIVAVDGLDQEVYEKHRKGGNLALVMSNLKKFIEARDRLKSRIEIDFQFIIFEHNQHQVEGAKALAHELKVDRLTIFPSDPHYDGYFFTGQAEERRLLGCYSLFVVADIDVDGNLYQCDLAEDNEAKPIGSMLTQDFASLWNHRSMQAARAGFRKGSKEPMSGLCRRCPTLYGCNGALAVLR